MILNKLLKSYKELTTDAHIKWMCDKLLDRREAFDIADYFKINRWLGFIQGYLYNLQLKTIEELRNETRGIDNELLGELCK